MSEYEVDDDEDDGPDEWGVDWSGIGDDDYFTTVDELTDDDGGMDGEDMYFLFDAVFGDDTDGLQEWIDSWRNG